MKERAVSDATAARDRARRHGGRWLAWLLRGAIAVAVASPAPCVEAAPVRGSGSAKASETKSPSLAQTRARALRRARRAALEAALRQVGGPSDPAARKAVLEAADAWTGAYRILSENGDGQDVAIEVEVEIDLVRLHKRVAKREGGGERPGWALGAIGSSEGCGDAAALSELVSAELSAHGSVALPGAEPAKPSKTKAPALDVAVDCQALGAVEHTMLDAARVRVVATADGRTVAEASVPAFAPSPAEAVAAGVRGALADVADALGSQGGGRVRLRVQSPMPAVRIRRLETAMRNSVLGVDEVEVGAIEKGVVELHVRGELSAKALSRALGQLSLPGFTLTVVRVEPPDVVTIRLQQ
jgi:hypothetical protein